MLRKLTTAVLFGSISLTGLLAIGCASDNETKPYALTGTAAEQERKEMLRYTDDKGHYRPDMRMQDRPMRPVQ